MRRILIVLSGAVDAETLRKRFAAHAGDAEALAVCAVLQNGEGGLAAGLRAQRELTTRLREALGEDAERVPVLVAWDEDGYRVEDCARDWGATEVSS